MKGYIYKITSPSTDKIYIGSTILSIKHRLYCHIKNNNCSSMEIIKYGNVEIILLEEMEYENKIELRKKENEYIEINKTLCVNKLSPYADDDAKKNYQSVYRSKHCAEINKKNNCECGGKYSRKHKSLHFKTKKHQNYLIAL